jgi:hypothetical protein
LEGDIAGKPTDGPDPNTLGDATVQNPYWHAKFKPHQIDRSEIRLLCFEIRSIVDASKNRHGSGLAVDNDEVHIFSILDLLCFEMAEAELSKRLLRLALMVRTFDDTIIRSDKAGDYLICRSRIEQNHGSFGAVFEGNENITNQIRECSNKIIHAEDVRPVYHTEDDRDDPEAMWGMDGTLELEGVLGRAPWKIAIYLDLYLEGVLELILFEE